MEEKVFSKKFIYSVIGGLATLCLIIYLVVVNMSSSTSIVNHLKVSFSGYDGKGELKYNSEEIRQEVEKAVFKKVGFNDKEIESLLLRNTTPIRERFQTMESVNKFEKAEAIIGDLDYRFDKMSNLNNGDKIIFNVSYKGKQSESPVKLETKEFIVKGLSKSTKLSVNELVKDSDVNFTGYNGFGKVKLDDEKFEIQGEVPDKLSNGDKVKVGVKESYVSTLAIEGKIVSNPKETVDIEVKGLKDISEISNIKEVIAKIDDLAKSETSNEASSFFKRTFTIEKQKDFIQYESSSFLTNSKPSLRVTAIYKVNRISDSENKTYYQTFGYSNLEIYGNKLILSDLSYKKSVGSKEFADLDSAIADLKSNDYVEYTK